MKFKSKLHEAKQRLLLRWQLAQIQTPLPRAVAEIQRRRTDPALRKAVSDFLEADIPLHFNGRLPIFYLSRYVATPDYETLQYIQQVKSYKMPIVIGEDPTDIFTSHSTLKRNLAKLPIITGTDKDGHGIVEFETILDFNEQQGKQLKDVVLKNNYSLLSFHRRLAKAFLPPNVAVVDESEWVDRHSRGKLVQLYESLLPLLITHGMMLEQYEPDETDFLAEVVLPAYKKTKERFGLHPLIVPLELEYSKKIKDLNSYPAKVRDYIRNNHQTDQTNSVV